MTLEESIKNEVREVPDFPKPGIHFKDITPLFLNPKLSKDIIIGLKKEVSKMEITAIAGIESRGFLFGYALALELDLPFVLIRKKGKLPAETYEVSYDLEYGSATLEIHKDALCKHDKVLIHDDLLATGGTACATTDLIQMTGAKIVAFSFILELSFLNGIKKLTPITKNIINLARY